MKTTQKKINGNGHHPKRRSACRSTHQFHKLREVRLRQGISLRSVARVMGTETNRVKQQEESSDLKLSALFRWQDALKVPVTELLAEPNDGLALPVLKRARILRIMKTAVSIRDAAPTDQIRNMARQLVDQLVELSPDLKEVSAWRPNSELPNSGYGRMAENTIPDDFFLGSH